MIPEKDPNYVYDERKKVKSGSPPPLPEFSGKPKHDLLLKVPQSIPEEKGSSVPTTAVPVPSSMEDIAQKAKRVRKTSEPRFGFFDYSMIPDKDPRCFKKN